MTDRPTRKPTGKPSWPILLLAGAEKTGKTYSAALAAGSDLVGRTSWITIGEDEPDEYGLLADFDIVYHDGSYADVLAAIREQGEKPRPEHGVPLLVIDSMSRLWDQLKDLAQDAANRKRGRKAGEDATITSDLWNVAAARWGHVMDAVRAFPGPVILTARLDVVAVMNEAGQPTTQKTTKIQGHKSLPYDVGAIVEMPARGEAWLTGARSVRFKLPERLRLDDFTVDGLWRRFGLDDTETGRRDHNAPSLEQPGTTAPQAAPRTQQSAPPPPPLPYDPAIGDEWAAQVRDATRLGHPNTDTSESDTLAGVLIRAQRAGVLRRLVDDPTRVPGAKTVEQLIDERRRELLRLDQEARALRARQEAAAA